MAQGIYKVTEDFEKALCDYTGAKYCVTVDNQSNALFLCMMFNNVKGLTISIPSRTYMSVPCEIIHAGAKVNFIESESETLTGAYKLDPTNIYDSALRFTADMYIPKSMMCLSFTGPYKHLKLSKGGAVLLDDERAYLWLKKARFSGRDELPYHQDNFDKNPVIGWNMYLMPELSARGLLMMSQFYTPDGNKKHNPDITHPYPDLSKFNIYKQ